MAESKLRVDLTTDLPERIEQITQALEKSARLTANARQFPSTHSRAAIFRLADAIDQLALAMMNLIGPHVKE